jgi:serine protease Do
MKKRNLFIAGLFLAVGIVLGVALTLKFDLFQQAESQDLKPPPATILPQNVGLEDAVINVANTTGKAVVSISTEHTTKIRGAKRYYFNLPFGESPFSGEDPFRSFFDDFMGDFPDREFKQRGLGSGVIIDEEGYILTNEHVINDADKITVTLSDGREFKGEVKGKDTRSDLAIIKVNARNLPVAVLGNSDNLKIGEWVVAIGNPFAFAMENPEPTVTCGVVSALHRSLGRALSSDRDYNDLIQTDAAINPGNSGGPLVNLKGEVVGINVAIFSTSGGYQGIGFAITANSAKRIISRLIEGKKILYGWLGITVQDLNEDLAKYFGLEQKEGVLVAKVLENGPAAKAGMRDSDVIRKIDGRQINNTKELLSVVGKTEPGRKVKAQVLRDKKELVLEIQIGERPENLEEAKYSVSEGAWRGLEVQDINEANARRYRLEEKRGVVVVEVEPGSPADSSGIIPGDIIVEINKKAVNSISDYEKITSSLKGDVLIKTIRGYFLVKE